MAGLVDANLDQTASRLVDAFTEGLVKTPEIIERLRARHPMSDGQWATIVELQGIDFVAVGTWPSTGYVVHGYEIKASRGDWLKEIKNPRKAEPGMAKVDFWWLACPAGIAKREEIPTGWGWCTVDERGTRTIIQPPRLRPETPKNKFVKGADGKTLHLNRERTEREAFAGLARRYAYAEADRAAIAAAGQMLDLTDALDAAAIATGRWTSSQRISKQEWEARQRAVQAAYKAKRSGYKVLDRPVTSVTEDPWDAPTYGGS